VNEKGYTHKQAADNLALLALGESRTRINNPIDYQEKRFELD